MTREFDGKVALITGSSGIGLGAALKLAREGADVYVCGIDDGHNVDATAAAQGLRLRVASVDVSDENAVNNWVTQIGENTGGIDILINAAAIQTYGTIETTDTDHWDKVMAVNLRSCYLTSRAAYPYMKNRDTGAILHVSSVQGSSNQNKVLAYATTKGAIHALTRAMAVDCAKDNIRVNSLSPGAIRTPLLEFAASQSAGEGGSIEEEIAETGRNHPIGRVGTIDETSELIAFLVSDRAGFCTGSDYQVDGGLTAHLGT